MRRGNPDGPFLAAARGKPTPHRPLWIMRQAGRYLPEYREMRERYSFLELCRDAEAAAEVTLQPLRRFDIDAAILFTDLLIPVEAMGVGLEYTPGPVLASTIDSMERVEALHAIDPELALRPMLDTVTRVREELPEEKALIGFVGAPFTLACYMIEGKGSKNWDEVRRMMHSEPDLFEALLDKVTACITPLIAALADRGCDAIQTFDSWANVLAPEDYARFCAPRTETMLRAAKDAGAVAIDYVNGAAQLFPIMAESCADVLAFDWRIPMTQARSLAPEGKSLQGNLDPTVLYADETELRRRVRAICDAAGPDRHVFNLGHGILPDVNPDAVQIVVEEVHGS